MNYAFQLAVYLLTLRRAAQRLGWRSGPINRSTAPHNNGSGSTPPLSAYLLRRFAARSSVSLAHVTGFASSDSAAARL